MNIKKIKNYLIKYWWIILLVIVILINIDVFEGYSDNYEEYSNPYIDDKNAKIKWMNLKSPFMNDNFPSTFEFDFSIKKDIIEKALNLPKNYGIIDCGAHIGDGAIPIAHALKHNNREDIMVYAIDPSKYKCDYITKIAEMNNIKNIKVIHYGLSDKDNTKYSYIPNEREKDSKINTGGWNWREKEQLGDNNLETIHFIKLDTLVEKGEINQKIGVIHLDVEGMEENAVRGGIKTINENKPYLTLECHENNPKKFTDILSNYEFVKRINSNNTFKPKEE